jgi:hypothetical protein
MEYALRSLDPRNAWDCLPTPQACAVLECGRPLPQRPLHCTREYAQAERKQRRLRRGLVAYARPVSIQTACYVSIMPRTTARDRIFSLIVGEVARVVFAIRDEDELWLWRESEALRANKALHRLPYELLHHIHLFMGVHNGAWTDENLRLTAYTVTLRLPDGTFASETERGRFMCAAFDKLCCVGNLPAGLELVAQCGTRTDEEIQQLIDYRDALLEHFLQLRSKFVQ